MDFSQEQNLRAQLVANHAWVRRLALGIVREDGAADDVAQEVMLAAIQRPPSSMAALRGWLATLTGRIAIDRARSESARRARQQRVSRTEADDAEREVVERVARSQRVVEVVMSLAEPLRSTVLLRYLDELPLAEVARRTAVSERTARTRLTEGLALLRARLDREFGEDSKSWALVLLGTPVVKGALLMNVKLVVGGVAAVLVALALLRWNTGAVEPPVISEMRAGPTPTALQPELSEVASEVASSRDPVVASVPVLPAKPPSLWYFRLVDATTTGPVAGGSASLEDGWQAKVNATADDLGYLELPRKPDGPALLWYLNATGHAPTAIVDARGGETRETAVEVPMRASCSLRVRVLDSERHPVRAPVELSAGVRETVALPTNDAEFRLAYNGGPDSHRETRSGLGEVLTARYLWTRRGDLDGVCTWECLPPEVAMRALVGAGKGSVLRIAPFTLFPGEARELEWVLPGTSALEVEAVDRTGAALPGVTLWAVDLHEGGQPFALFKPGIEPAGTAVTDANGHARFQLLQGGDWYVGPARQDAGGPAGIDPGAFAPIGTLKHLNAGDATATERLVLDQGLYVGGVVVSASGTPPPVLIWVSAEQMSGRFETQSQADGSFLLGPVPRLPLTLSPHIVGGTSLPSLKVAGGDLSVAVIVPPIGAVELSVSDAESGVALGIESVRVEDGPSKFETEYSGKPKPLSVRLENVLAGTYTIVVCTEGAKVAFERDVHIGGDAATPRKLLAHAGCAVALTNHTQANGVVRAYLDQNCVGLFDAPAGETTQARVPAGKLRFRFSGAESSDRNLELRAGESGAVEWP